MITVRILVSIAGHADPTYNLEDFAFQPAQVVDLDDTLAGKWIAGGIAEALEVEPHRETASLEAPRKAVLPAGSRKRPG
jgi:hypothetical protein